MNKLCVAFFKFCFCEGFNEFKFISIVIKATKQQPDLVQYKYACENSHPWERAILWSLFLISGKSPCWYDKILILNKVPETVQLSHEGLSCWEAKFADQSATFHYCIAQFWILEL